MDPDAACSDSLVDRKNSGLFGVVLATAGAVASTYLAAVTTQPRILHLFALVAGATLSVASAMALIFRKAERATPKVTLTVAGVIAVLAAISVTGMCSLLALEGPRRQSLIILVSQLEANGFYSYAMPGAAEKGRRAATAEEVAFEEATGRAFPCDPVELAQGGAIRFIVRLSPFLKSQGISLGPLESTFEAGGAYSLRAGDARQQLWSAEEGADPQAWRLCATRLLQMVNRLCGLAGSPERLRLFPRGKEWIAVFLTDEQRSTLHAAGACLHEDQ